MAASFRHLAPTAAMLLPRLADFSELDDILVQLGKSGARHLFASLRMPGDRFNSRNPTGRYCLDLGVVADRALAYHLLLVNQSV